MIMLAEGTAIALIVAGIELGAILCIVWLLASLNNKHDDKGDE